MLTKKGLIQILADTESFHVELKTSTNEELIEDNLTMFTQLIQSFVLSKTLKNISKHKRMNVKVA